MNRRAGRTARSEGDMGRVGLVMKGIYELHPWDRIWCHDTYTDLHKSRFRHLKVDSGGHRHTYSIVISKRLLFYRKVK
jgi:hypothetical protein